MTGTLPIASAPCSFGVDEVVVDDAWMPGPDEMLDWMLGIGYAGTELGPPSYLGAGHAARERLDRRGLQLVGCVPARATSAAPTGHPLTVNGCAASCCCCATPLTAGSRAVRRPVRGDRRTRPASATRDASTCTPRPSWTRRGFAPCWRISTEPGSCAGSWVPGRHPPPRGHLHRDRRGDRAHRRRASMVRSWGCASTAVTSGMAERTPRSACVTIEACSSTCISRIPRPGSSAMSRRDDLGLERRPWHAAC